jgi:hypothetical protein
MNELTENSIGIASNIIDAIAGIPVIGTGIGLVKFAKNLSDKCLQNKLNAIIFGYNKIPDDKYSSYADKISEELKDKNKLQKLGEQTWLIIDKADSIKTAALIGGLLKLLVKGRIDKTLFLELCHIANRIYPDYIANLQFFEKDDTTLVAAKKSKIPQDVFFALESNMLIRNCGLDGGDAANMDETNGYIFCITEYGKILRYLIPCVFYDQ